MTLALVILLGAVIGSFLNVLIYRIPNGESVVFPASHCQSCHTPLKIWHNIPIISWLFLGGKCAFCKTKISIQYPIIESISALLFTLAYLEFGQSHDTLVYAIVFDLFLVMSMIDWRYKAVPDSLNLLAFTVALFAGSSFITNLQHALLFAGAFTMLRFFISYYLYVKFNTLEKSSKPASWRRLYNPLPTHFEAMGEADIIIAATIGALLGVELGLFALFLSALLTLPVALLRRKHDHETPFVPFLALATLITFIFYEPIGQFIGGLYA